MGEIWEIYVVVIRCGVMKIPQLTSAMELINR